MENRTSDRKELAIIGAGLAGLTAAASAARAGAKVTVYERSTTLGGRAATRCDRGFSWNLGPHALYRSGHAARILGELGVAYRGHSPAATGGAAIHGGRKHKLPGGFGSLLTTSLLGPGAKLELARLLGSVQRIDAAALTSTSVADWLDELVRHRAVAELLSALVRLTTYTNADHLMSAGAALEQLQMALAANVLYLDGGWQTLVDGLEKVARDAGVRIETGARVREVECRDEVSGLRLDDGALVRADAVVMATSPVVARSLVTGSVRGGRREHGTVARGDGAVADPIPVRAACLDLALSKLPVPAASFALGIDRPLYLSVHSAVADLAPAGGAVVHVAKYLDPSVPADPRADEAELEGLLDLVQPGWREAVVDRRFLPALVVTNAVVLAEAGGCAGRSPVEVPEVAGLFVAGDWVGARGQLADAAVASGEEAADRACRYLRRARSEAA